MSKASRHKKALSEAVVSNKKRRRRIFFCGFATVAILAVSIGLFYHRRQQITARPADKADTADIKLRYAKLNAIIAKAWIGVQGEPDAEELLRDFARKVIVGKLSSYGEVSHQPRPGLTKDDAVFVIFVSRSEMKLVPTPITAPFSFETAMNSIVMAELGPMNDETLAPLLVHEIYHWRVFVQQGKRIDTEEYSEPRLREEVMAHELERRVANRITNGAYDRTIEEALKSDALSRRNETGFRVLTVAGMERMHAVWSEPSLSLFEEETRTSSAAIAIRLAQIPNMDAKIRAYADIRRASLNRDFRK